MRRLPLLALALALAALAGCQRLNYKKTFNLDIGESPEAEFGIDGPAREQKITVQVTADEPVKVYVFLEEDAQAARDAIDKFNKPAQALAGKENEKEVSLEATIPAKKGYFVYVGLGNKVRKAKGELHVQGR